MEKLLDGAMERISEKIRADLALARRDVIGMDCWSKKTLTASFLAIAVSFFHPLRLQPVHVLLELYQISHLHTGEMLADKLVSALDRWGTDKHRQWCEHGKGCTYGWIND